MTTSLPRESDRQHDTTASTSAVQGQTPRPSRVDHLAVVERAVVNIRPFVTSLAFLLVVGLALGWVMWRESVHLGWYGVVVGTLLAVKLVASLLPEQKWSGDTSALRTCAVVPFYNEDPAILARTLRSLDQQDRPLNHVVVVDDGSENDIALRTALEWAQGRPDATVLTFGKNQGKRHAMAAAFRGLAGQVDVWVCVDSDTVLDPAAVAEGLKPFTDPGVAAATGTVVALNARHNLLTRLIDLRYVNAFLYERAAYSRVGSVLCVCGSLALWRADVVEEHLDDFTGQMFWGRSATFGDDRHLTNLALLHGRVVLARRAVARTAVPQRFGHFARQQVRWSKSFFRESIWSLRHLPPTRAGWWLAAIELLTWTAFTASLLAVLAVGPVLTGRWLLADYLAWVLLAGLARSVHVFSIERSDWNGRQLVVTFLMSAVHGLVFIVALLPLRLYSLATIRRNGWGTRADGVEVSAPEVRAGSVTYP